MANTKKSRNEKATDLANSDGYKEMMTTPLMSRLMGKSSPSARSISDGDSIPSKLASKSIDSNIQPIQDLSENDSDSDILKKMFNFMKSDYHWKNEKHKKDIQNKKTLTDDATRRSDELIGLFTGKKKKVSRKAESGQKEKKLQTLKKEVDTKVKPTEKPTAVPEKPVSVRPSTIIAGIGAVGLAAVASKISASESKGSTTQANIVQGTNVKEHRIVKGNVDVTTGREFEKPLNEMTIAEAVDLGNRRAKYYKGKGGSALGKYQFIPSTLEETAKKLYGEDWRNRIFDDQAQEDINMTFLYGNAQRLQKAGLPVSDASLYMMHFFGNPVQAGMVLNGSDNTSMRSILNFYYDNGKSKVDAAAQNPQVAALTVGEYKKKYLSRYDFKTIDIPAEQQIPAQIKNPSNKKPASSVISTNTNVYKGGTSYNVTTPNQNNNSPLVDAQYNN